MMLAAMTVLVLTAADAGTQTKVTMRDAFEALLMSGQRLRVTWAEGERKITRRGFATEWNFPHDRMDDIGWSATFQWGDRGEGPRESVEPRADNFDQQVNAALQQLRLVVGDIELNVIAAQQSILLGSASAFTLGDLESLATVPSQMFGQLKNLALNATSALKKIADIAATAAEDPAVVANQAMSLAESVTAQIISIHDEFTRQVPEAYSAAADRPAVLAQMFTYFSGVEERAEDCASAFDEIARSLRARSSAIVVAGAGGGPQQLAPDILGVHLPKTGETFLTISKKWYGTPDRGSDIARANGFPEYQIAPEPGSVLVIPTIKAIEKAQSKF